MPNNFGVPQISDEKTRDAINGALDSVTAFAFPDMQRAFERVSKVLATANIMLPRISTIGNEEGLEVIPVTQGMNDDYSVYFEWQREDNGQFSVFCNLVDMDELEDLLNNSDHLDSLPDWEDINEAKEYSTIALANNPENFVTADDLADASVSMNNQATKEKHPQLKQMYLDTAKAFIEHSRKKLAMEEAPPGAKYERMVKHIKTNLAKDGYLSKKDKAIAYGSAWKTYKKHED